MADCPSGQHSHEGYTKCHSISIQHKNPETMKYHQMELQGKTYSKTEREGISSSKPQEGTPKSPTQTKFKPFNKRNAFYNNSLRAMLGKDNKNPLFVPMFTAWAGLSILSNIYNKVDAYSQKHRIDGFKKGYEKGWDYIESVTIRGEDGKLRPMKDWTEEEVTAMTQTLEAKKKALEKSKRINQKNSAEYGQYKVICDYLDATKKLKGMSPEEMALQAEGYGKSEIPDPSGRYYRLIRSKDGSTSLKEFDGDGNEVSANEITNDEWKGMRTGKEEITLSDGTKTEAYYTLKAGKDKNGRPLFYKAYRVKASKSDTPKDDSEEPKTESDSIPE